MGSASCQAGTGWELRVITAVILGGASLKGGAGTVLGSFLGVLLMALLSNALVLLGVDIYWQQFVVGLVLISTVVIDTLGRRVGADGQAGGLRQETRGTGDMALMTAVVYHGKGDVRVEKVPVPGVPRRRAAGEDRRLRDLRL